MGGIISAIFGGIELLVGLRFIFELLAANPYAEIVSWVYSASQPLVAPFEGIFNTTTFSPNPPIHSVFEPAILVALIVYAAIGGILLRLVGEERY